MTFNLRKLLSDTSRAAHFAAVVGEQPIASPGERARIAHNSAGFPRNQWQSHDPFTVIMRPGVFLCLSFSFSFFPLLGAFVRHHRRRHRIGKLSLTP